MIGKDRKSHAGKGKQNQDYFAFGKDVLAPGPGVVIATENTVPDNVPGVMNPSRAAGNFVLIDHENGEYSLLAHLKQGSVKVRVGDHTSPGQTLGLCGNSGNSSEPHLHYHLQNSPVPLEGNGLPIFFKDVVINGRRVADAELEQGALVSPVE